MSKNLLFLLVDQWPADCFSYKGAKIETPTIDRLAAEGTDFVNAFTTCPLCSPARGGLLTSRWHTQTGMMDNLNVGYSRQAPLKIEEPTWLDGALANGYHVGYYGKWHLGEDGPKLRGVQGHPQVTEQGHVERRPEDIHYDYNQCQATYMEEGKALISGHAPFYGKVSTAIEATNPFQVVDEAKGFIKDYVAADLNQPFLLTVSINDPHFPHYLPETFLETLQATTIDLPMNIDDDFSDKPSFHKKPWWPSMDTSELSKEDWSDVIKYAYSHRMLVDRALGEVIQELEANDLMADTTIIFTSDHGDMCGAHNRFDKGPYYYDEVWRVPLIIRQGDEQPAVQEAYVSLLDVGRSVFDFVGADHPTTEGRSLWPMVGKSTRPEGWQQVAYGMYDLYNGMSFKVRAIRNDAYKYVFNPQALDEFYDMKNDPYELTNLQAWGKVEEKKNAMKAQLFKWMEKIDDPLLGELGDLPEAGTILINGKAGP